jgi:predicted ABC-type ATPase
MGRQPPEVLDKIERTKERLSQVVATDAPVSEGGFRNPDGTWTDERTALHQEIISNILTPEAVAAAMPAPGESPTYTMLGGRAGSGKSWLSSSDGPVDASKSFVLDNDRIKGMLPEYQGWNAGQVHEEASHIFNVVDHTARQLGINVTHDATLKSSANAEKFVNAYKDSGYKVEGYYMFASPAVATERAIGRFMGPSGRFVPPEYSYSSRTNEASFDKLIPSFSKWAVYDGSPRSGASYHAPGAPRAPRLVGSGGSS